MPRAKEEEGMGFSSAITTFATQAMSYFHMIAWQLVGVLGIWHGLTYMQGELTIPTSSRMAIGVGMFMAAVPVANTFNPWMLSMGVPSTLMAQNLATLLGIYGGTIGALGLVHRNPRWVIQGIGGTVISWAWPAIWQRMGGLIGGAASLPAAP